MAKKGKFKLLSYLIEDYLLFYKSLNKKKRLFAFSIFKVARINQIIPILNEFLKKGFFYYYSVQIPISNEDIDIILCFRAEDKNKVIELFGITHHKLIEYESNKFYFEKDLENFFINIIFKKSKSSNVRIFNKDGTILIKNHTTEKIFNLYEISFKKSNDDNTLMHLKELIKSLDQKGYLILNFQNLENNIALNSYYIQIRRDMPNNKINIEEEVKNFFNLPLLKKTELSLNSIYQLLWRKNINKNFISYDKTNKFISSINYPIISNLKEFNLKFENLLKSNKIEYQRLNDNLVFIERRILFLTQVKIDFKLIMRLFKRFFSKYLIYLLVLDEKEYERILKVEKIDELKELIILNYKEFSKLKFEEFKN